MSNELDLQAILTEFGLTEELSVTPSRFTAWSRLAAIVAPIVVAKNLRIVGVEGSQGSGKSTLSRAIVDALSVRGVSAATVSLDDFYLGRDARADLAAQVHPLLRTRGVPGTHDWQRLTETIQAHEQGRALTIPQFDKGLDDRTDDVRVECDCLILEGWCLGVTQQAPDLLETPVNELEAVDDVDRHWRTWVNDQIRHYEPIWSHIQYWLQLRVPSFEQVYRWRGQQELDLPADQRMSEEDLRRFIQHYERITRHLWSLPSRSPGLSVELNANHDLAKVEASHD